MLDTLAVADRQLADALDGIVSSRARVSRATVAALERVLATLRPAADVRAQLARVDRRVLAAAICSAAITMTGCGSSMEAASMASTDARPRTPSISELQAALLAVRNGEFATGPAGSAAASPAATVPLEAADRTPGRLEVELLDVASRPAGQRRPPPRSPRRRPGGACGCSARTVGPVLDA